jgi:hypothetical protein
MSQASTTTATPMAITTHNGGLIWHHACKHCPFCGGVAAFSKNEPSKMGCITPGCAINGLLMTPEQWEKRA